MAEHELSALAKCCRHIIIKSLKTFQITLVKVGNEMIDQRNEREQNAPGASVSLEIESPANSMAFDSLSKSEDHFIFSN